MTIYKITSLIGGFGPLCPPPVVYALWPSFDGWTVTVTETECVVEVPDGGPEPRFVSNLLKIEKLS